MIQNAFMALLVLAIIIPIGIFFITEGRLLTANKAKRFKSLLGVNVVSFFAIMLVATFFMFSGTALAESTGPSAAFSDEGMRYLAAALCTSCATIAAGMATGSAACAALGALSENDSIMGRALIFVALAEGIAIYGLLISFMILNK